VIEKMAIRPPDFDKGDSVVYLPVMPERDLIIGILSRALEDLNGNVTGVLPKEKSRIQLDAARWIRSNRRKPFSFLWICDQLDLNASGIRERLRLRGNGG
jgi:hypothetical protein